jgi:ABC-type Fe3+-hydroxamate transport system substrate-binding protein
MRKPGLPLLLAMLLALAGCASLEPGPPPLSAADVIALAKEGKSPQQIIDELKRTATVLPLQASDIIALHEAGVPSPVLDYLQLAQIDEIRWRDRYSYYYWYGPGYYRFGPCPWGFRGTYRGGPWGC